MRRYQIVLLVLTVFIAGLTARPAAARDLKFGFTPVLGEAEMRAEFDPLAAYLSEAIGQKVVLYVAKDYGDLQTQMETPLAVGKMGCSPHFVNSAFCL